MPYISVPPGTAERVDRMIQVAGVGRTAEFLGITTQQARSLAAGTGRVFRVDKGEPGRLEGSIKVIEKNIIRLQHVSPKGIAKEDIPKNMERLSDLMKGERTLQRRKHYMMILRDLGMDPAKLPDPLST